MNESDNTFASNKSSYANMSAVDVTGTFSAITHSSWVRVGGANYPESNVGMLLFKDDTEAAEYARLLSNTDVGTGIVSGTITIYTYSGTSSSISYTSQITAAFAPYYISIKRNSPSQYLVYLMDYGTNEIHKIVCSPSGSTDTIITTVPIPASSSSQQRALTTFFWDGKIYYLVILNIKDATWGWYKFKVYLYVFDTQTDSLTGGLQYDANGSTGDPGYYLGWQRTSPPTVYGYVGFSNGSPYWYLFYFDFVYGATTGTLHVMRNGVDVTTLGGVNLPTAAPSINHYVNQYNRRDHLYFANLQYCSTAVTVSSAGTVNTYTSSIPTIPFNNMVINSKNIFPALYWDGSSIWNIDKETGAVSGELLVSGVSSVFALFPTPDIYDNAIYIMAPNPSYPNYKLLGITEGGAVLRETPVDTPLYYFQGTGRKAFNLGRWMCFLETDLVQPFATILRPSAPTVSKGKSMMIVEMN